MALTPELQALLAKYRAAYAALIAGELVTEISTNGRSVKYGPADLPRLEREIARLEALDAGRRPRGAIRFTL